MAITDIIILGLFLVALIVILSVGMMIFSTVRFVRNSRKTGQLLQSWAQENGYSIIEQERRRFARGPFFWNTGSGQSVFRVTAQDSHGNKRSGWIRVGVPSFRGVPDETLVRWDDEKSKGA